MSAGRRSAFPHFVRLTRAQVFNIQTEDDIEAARAVGKPPRQMALRQVLPNTVAPLLVPATLAGAADLLAGIGLQAAG